MVPKLSSGFVLNGKGILTAAQILYKERSDGRITAVCKPECLKNECTK